MSDYTKTTNFAAKDSLPSGNSGKIVKGTEIDTEFTNIQTAVATKANIAGPTFTGTTTFETISDGTINITAFVDEDNMASDSATLVPTQQSVKAYVDSQVTAQDLDFQADSGGALSIDLDSETLTFTGGTGIDTSGSGNAVTFAIDSTVATLTGTQTLTNKTLTSPTLNTPTIGTSFTIGAATITEAELEILDGATVTTDELNVLDGITSTTAELNILDGVTSTAAELNILDGVTSTAAELNILDGVTSTTAELNLVDGATAATVVNSKAVIYGTAGEVNASTLQVGGVAITSTPAELNILDGVTATTAELNILDGVTSTTAELNILDGVTATATELNLLDGVTATTAELNYVDGVTSAIQTQIDTKAPLASPTFTGTVTAAALTVDGAIKLDGNYPTGTGNVAVGDTALDSIASGGQYNVAIGSAAGTAVTTGVSNTYIGALAGDASTTGDYNVAVGQNALGTDTKGDRSTVVGTNALANQNFTTNTNAYNVAIGYEALNDCTTGENNTAVGSLAADKLTTGSLNVFIGKNSAGSGVVTGNDNTAVGVNSASNLTSGTNNLFLGHDAGVSGSPGGNFTNSSNTIVLGDENIVNCHIQVDWTVASDERDKTDFTALDLGLDFVKALEPVTYYWDKRSKYGNKFITNEDGKPVPNPDYDLDSYTPDGTHKEDWMDIGFKAQAVKALEEAAGYTAAANKNLTVSTTDDGKQLGLQYSKFVPILVKAIQDQDAIITALIARIEALEA